MSVLFFLSWAPINCFNIAVDVIDFIKVKIHNRLGQNKYFFQSQNQNYNNMYISKCKSNSLYEDKKMQAALHKLFEL